LARDNFTTKVIERIRGRVANRCSNPLCRVQTTGPATDDDKVNIIGIAAHIHAASEGGPRYKAAMTPRQRKSMENGIWLCANCSIDIDKDVARYSPELLNEWKKEAERLAREELGQKLPGKNDAINTVTSALTGLPTVFLPQAIGNTIKATTNVLENLDSRFVINAAYNENVTTFTLSAKEDVKASLEIKPEYAQEFSFKLEKLINHGEVLEVDTELVQLKGSRLLEEMTSHFKQGKLRLLPPLRKKALVKLVLVGDDGDIHLVEDVRGELIAGKKTMSFNGSTYDGLFSVDFTSELSSFGTQPLNFNFGVDFDKFLNVPVTQLSNFDDVYTFYERINAGQKLVLNLEIEGKLLIKGTLDDIRGQSNFQYIHSCINFVHICRNILNYLNIDVTFSPGFNILPGIFDLLSNINAIITGNNVFSADRYGSASTVIIIKDKQAAEMMIEDGPRAMSFEQTETSTIDLFGHSVTLPKISIMFDKVVPHLEVDINDIQAGQAISVKWFFEPDCMCTIAFI